MLLNLWNGITGITTLKNAICVPNVFKNVSEIQIINNFVTISHINY